MRTIRLEDDISAGSPGRRAEGDKPVEADTDELRRPDVRSDLCRWREGRYLGTPTSIWRSTAAPQEGPVVRKVSVDRPGGRRRSGGRSHPGVGWRLPFAEDPDGRVQYDPTIPVPAGPRDHRPCGPSAGGTDSTVPVVTRRSLSVTISSPGARWAHIGPLPGMETRRHGPGLRRGTRPGHRNRFFAASCGTANWTSAPCTPGASDGRELNGHAWQRPGPPALDRA